jgi:RNA polymerase sigma factor, sigma-70 family
VSIVLRKRRENVNSGTPGAAGHRGFEVRVSSEFEVQVTEDYEVAQATAETVRVEHSSPDRARARELFERLAVLAPEDPERARIRGYLVELHLPLVEYLARRFRNRGEWLDDLTQVATIGLIKSIDRFDLERGVEFSTYATPTIVGEIKRHFRDKGWAVRVPRRLQELKLSLTKAIGDLAQREGRAPTVAEIAAHLQMSEEEVLEGLESGQRLLDGLAGRPGLRGRRRARRRRVPGHAGRGPGGRGVPASRSSHCWNSCPPGRSGSCCSGSSGT